MVKDNWAEGGWGVRRKGGTQSLDCINIQELCLRITRSSSQGIKHVLQISIPFFVEIFFISFSHADTHHKNYSSHLGQPELIIGDWVFIAIKKWTFDLN